MNLTKVQKIILGIFLAVGASIALSAWHAKGQKEEERMQAIAKVELRKKAAAEFQAKESQRLRHEAAQRQEAETRKLDEKREELQRVLDQSLHDPYAIRLRNVRLVQGNGGYALCGDISAKTASGKYFPERAFAVTEFPIEKAPGQVIGVSKSDELPEPKSTAEMLISAGCQ